MSALTEALMEPWGPFEMGGFDGCTDRNPDYCACATDQQPTCEVCGREIERGEQAWARNWPCYNTLPLDHKDQDWDVISWHDECPDASVIPPAACPDCGHQHTPNGCTGDPTASDLWAGVTPAVCDCPRVLPPGSDGAA